MAEVGSIRGGDGSIPGEEIKKEPQFLQPSTRLAILSAMAPTRSEAEIGDLRRLVLAAEPTKTYTIPSQVEPKYTCDVCGNRDQTRFLHESKDGAISASHGAAAPPRHRRDSCPSDEVVGGFFFEFE